MSDTANLIRLMRAKRESWLELEAAADGRPALRVKLRRPTAWEVTRDFPDSAREPIANARDYVVDWEGFSEAVLLDDHAVGSSDPIPFNAGLWAEFVGDRMPMLGAVISRLVEMVNEYAAARQDAEKN